jgi:hypothetical protein
MELLKDTGNPVDVVKLGLDKLTTAFRKYGELGATDTEPSVHLQAIVHALVEHRSYTVPRTAAAWELYSDKPGAEAAARDLARNVISFIRTHNLLRATSEEWVAIRSHLRSFAWRYSYED